MNSSLWRFLTAVLATLVLATTAPAADTEKAAAKGSEEEPETNFLITPQLRMIDVHGDKGKFREHYWMQDGWTGGIEEFQWRQMFGAKKNILMEVEARGIYGDEDYALKFQVVKPDFGFIRSGFTQYKKYFDDDGGYYAPFRIPNVELNREMALNIGNWYVDFGLTLPNLPKITLGFEHQSKEGDKSMAEWGSVVQTISGASITKNIYPTFKDIDERVDIFKVDLDYDIGKVHMGNNFRYEIYDNNTARFDDTGSNLGPGGATGQQKPIRIHEDFTHDQISNAYFVESHVHEKVYLSGGYLYSDLSGGGDFWMNTFYLGGAPVGGTDKFWRIDDLDLEQDSHVLNANIMVGPFWGTTFYAGVQAEQSYVDAYSDSNHREGAVLPGPHVQALSSTDKERLDHHAGIRFTMIPYTVVYGEARRIRESIDAYRSVFDDGAAELEQRTDGDIERDEYVAGFSTSPMRRVSLTGQYRNSSRANVYDHKIDTESGYPAFITEQEFQTHEISGKLTVRPHNRVTVTAKYQLVQTDISTETQRLAAGATVPGGTADPATYYASIYSINATFTPMNRLYLNAYFSYTDSQTKTDNGRSYTTNPFENDVYTAMASVMYGLDEKTDLELQYMFQRALTFDNNAWDGYYRPLNYGFGVGTDTGLPMGLDSTRHVASVGLSRRLTQNITAKLRYGFFKYDEEHNGGMNDYFAHMALATCAIRF